MGDRLGTLGAVGITFLTFVQYFGLWDNFFSFKKHAFDPHNCQRPYHAEYTSSRPITEVKQR